MLKNKKKIIAFIPLILFAFLCLYAVIPLIQGKDPSIIDTPMIDKPIPALNLSPFNGQDPFTNEDLKDQVILVNIFASWCVPCQIEHPQLMTLKDEVTIYGLNYKDTDTKAQKWLNDNGNPYSKIGTDPKGVNAINLGVYGVPETYIIDRHGRIQYKHTGPIMPQDLETFRQIMGTLK